MSRPTRCLRRAETILLVVSYLILILGMIAMALAIVWRKELSRGKKSALFVVGLAVTVGQGFKVYEESQEALRQSASGEFSPPLLYGRPVTVALGHPAGPRFTWRDDLPFFLRTLDLQLRIRQDRLFISARIRDRSGHPVAEMWDNEWQVNNGNRFQRNFSPDGKALEIIDERGDVVLQFRIIDELVVLSAKYYDERGIPRAIGRTPGALTGSIVTGSPEESLDWFKIDRIFRYPSGLHFGELAKPTQPR